MLRLDHRLVKELDCGGRDSGTVRCHDAGLLPLEQLVSVNVFRD